MLTAINIYHVDIHQHVPKLEPALAQRLEALTGEDAACCVADYTDIIASARRTPAFSQALLRAKAMSDEKRLTALALVKRKGEMCACEIQAALDLSHGTVSHHMTTLEEAGLVTVERRGRWAHYAITKETKEMIP